MLTKNEARHRAYAQLHAARAARFPFPIEGRIPNFTGAETAARALRELPLYQQAKTIKVNPDAPQLPVRAMALADGKRLYMPSPRLRGSFLCIDPDDVPSGEYRRAASLSHCRNYGREVDIAQLLMQTDDPLRIDLIVVGSVAVTRRGARAGKGEGYADMEYALLQELGHPPIPVVTTVHGAQVLPDFPVEAHDLSVDVIVTPDEVIITETPYPKPRGIDWSLLTDDDLAAMPVLKEVRRHRWEQLSTPDLVAADLKLLFVGVNPGRTSAAEGHHFAGPGNHFWRLLHDAGLAPQLFTPEQDKDLLDLGIGITNVVERASRSESDLAWDELLAGGRAMREKVAAWRPRVVALLGKNVYRAYAGLPRSRFVEWGLQTASQVEGTIDYVAPNPSARSTVSYEERLMYFRRLADLVADLQTS